MTRVLRREVDPAVSAGTTATYAAFIFTGFAFASWASRIPQVRDRLDLDPAQLGLVLLAIGLSHAGPVQGLLRLVHDAFGTEAELPANRWKAAGLLTLSLLLAVVAASV